VTDAVPDAARAFQPFDTEFRRDPFPVYAAMRRAAPVYRHPDWPAVSLFRYADVQALLRDPKRFSNDFPLPQGMERPEDQPASMLGTDPPEHTRLRGLVSQAFTPRRVARLEGRIREIAHALLDDACTRRTVDLVTALTYPLPVIVIAEMIGIPAEDRERFKVWSDAAVADLGSGLLAPIDEARLNRQRRVVAEMRAYFLPLVEARRREPRDDLLSGLVAAELEGQRLTFDEMMQTLILLLVAGNETTTNLIGNAVLELLAHPDALAAVRAEPALVGSMVEEVLRFSSPVQMDPRRALQACEIGGVPIRANDIVIGWIGAANRDPEVFADPDRFDVRRTDNRHLAFGFGPHYCLGSNLATLEARVALQVLLERTRDVRRVDDAPLPLHPSPVFRGVTSLPVVLEPASS
jgi:cytochrome P450